MVAVLIVADALRLVALPWAQYRRDDAIVYDMALAALAAPRLPLVGMISTLGIDNGPAQVWLAALGALTGPAPYVADAVIALLNVVGVAACFAAGREAFGRRVGLIAALLFAVSSWSVLYSRRLWGNDMTAPFAALALWSLARVLRRGDRAHQVLVFLWSALLAQVYVVALVELPAIALGVLLALARRRLRPAPVMFGGALFALLTGPYIVGTVLPELGNVRRLAAGAHPVTDATSLRFVARTVGLDAYQFYLPWLSRTLDAAVRPWSFIGLLAALALALGALVALANLWRTSGAGNPASRSMLAVALAFVALPVAVTARHSVSLFPHYELVAAPATYLLMALGLGWLFDRRLLVGIGGAALLIVVAGQGIAAGVFLANVHEYVRGTEYGVPLADVQALGVAASAATHADHTAPLYVVGHYDGAEMGQALQTWAGPVAILDDQGSLRIPTGDATLALLTTTDDSPLVAFLRQAASSVPYEYAGDGTVFRLFTVSAGRLRAEASAAAPSLPPATLGGDLTLAGSSLRLEDESRTLVWTARWTVTAQGAQAKPIASVFAHVISPRGKSVAAHDEAFDNQAALWHAGDTILTWVRAPLPAGPIAGDRVVGGLYRLGPANAIIPLVGPSGPQVTLGGL